MSKSKPGKFLGSLVFPTRRKDGKYVVTHIIRYLDEEGVLHVVPSGFVTDLVSAPKVLKGAYGVLIKWAYNPDGKSWPAAVLHDFYYATQWISRKKADDLFLEALKAGGVRLGIRYAMWLGVRAFGWWPWAKHQE